MILRCLKNWEAGWIALVLGRIMEVHVSDTFLYIFFGVHMCKKMFVNVAHKKWSGNLWQHLPERHFVKSHHKPNCQKSHRKKGANGNFHNAHPRRKWHQTILGCPKFPLWIRFQWLQQKNANHQVKLNDSTIFSVSAVKILVGREKNCGSWCSSRYRNKDLEHDLVNQNQQSHMAVGQKRVPNEHNLQSLRFSFWSIAKSAGCRTPRYMFWKPPDSLACGALNWSSLLPTNWAKGDEPMTTLKSSLQASPTKWTVNREPWKPSR